MILNNTDPKPDTSSVTPTHEINTIDEEAEPFESSKVWAALEDDAQPNLQGFFKKSFLSELKIISRLFLQIGFFWLINEVGQKITTSLGLPIPGNIMGICLLFILLLVGAVKVRWIELASSVLTRHMTLFFVPITVGIMGYTELFETRGMSIFATLFVSTVIGLVACAMSVKLAQSRKNSGKMAPLDQAKEPPAQDSVADEIHSQENKDTKS